jgi:hypothetical protein
MIQKYSLKYGTRVVQLLMASVILLNTFPGSLIFSDFSMHLLEIVLPYYCFLPVFLGWEQHNIPLSHLKIQLF